MLQKFQNRQNDNSRNRGHGISAIAGAPSSDAAVKPASATNSQLRLQPTNRRPLLLLATVSLSAAVITLVSTKLTVLNLSNNKLQELPSAIGELPMLKSLDASFNLITRIPEEIRSAASLVKLDASGNKLSELPSSLGRCLALSDLKVSNNCINSLPEELARCSKLDVEQRTCWVVYQTILEVCQSSSAWTFIKTGGHLATLDLHSNQLKEFPVEAYKLHLSVPDLSNNSLSGLPPEIGKVSDRGLQENLIEFLAESNVSLVSGPTPALLKFLCSRLPQNGDSEASTSAKEDIVATAARMSLGSKDLFLEGLGLSAVPSKVWESGEIVKLDLSRNSIQGLPVELSSSVSLQTLILSKNKIKECPGSILKSLSSLTCLKLNNNILGPIPTDGFQAVPMLQILDLSCNPSALSSDPAFSTLRHLHELYLRACSDQPYRC